MNDSTMLLRACALGKTFRDGENETEVLHKLDFGLAHGEMVAVFGPSGSGKSTFLHLLSGLEVPTTGQVFWGDEDINQLSERKRCWLRGAKLGFVYQFHHLLPEFTALENVMMPALIARRPLASAMEKAAECLDAVGLAHRLKHKPSELSGGERQRTAIARALINDPMCVLADEPTGNLDEASARNFYELIATINERLKTAFLLVTHDQMALQYLNKSYMMRNGQIALQAN